MEQIKDMVTLRAFALATVGISRCDNFDGMIDKAKKLESYILGDAKLPESYEDKTMDVYKDFMKEIAPKKQTAWFLIDDEIKPAYDIPVVVKIEETDGYFIGQYTKESGWNVINAPYKRSIVAWLPIPEYKGQTI